MRMLLQKGFQIFQVYKERKKQMIFLLLSLFRSISILIIYLSVYWDINQDLYNLVCIMSWNALWKSILFFNEPKENKKIDRVG